MSSPQSYSRVTNTSPLNPNRVAKLPADRITKPWRRRIKYYSTTSRDKKNLLMKAFRQQTIKTTTALVNKSPTPTQQTATRRPTTARSYHQRHLSREQSDATFKRKAAQLDAEITTIRLRTFINTHRSRRDGGAATMHLTPAQTKRFQSLRALKKDATAEFERASRRDEELRARATKPGKINLGYLIAKRAGETRWATELQWRARTAADVKRLEDQATKNNRLEAFLEAKEKFKRVEEDIMRAHIEENMLDDLLNLEQEKRIDGMLMAGGVKGVERDEIGDMITAWGLDEAHDRAVEGSKLAHMMWKPAGEAMAKAAERLVEKPGSRVTGNARKRKAPPASKSC